MGQRHGSQKAHSLPLLYMVSGQLFRRRTVLCDKRMDVEKPAAQWQVSNDLKSSIVLLWCITYREIVAVIRDFPLLQ